MTRAIIVVFVIIVYLCTICCGVNEFIGNHSFIFVSGWPQSGTSLIQQFIEASSDISTMMQKCEALLGKRCVNWNHEGQWLLPGETRLFFNSGSMCPSSGLSPTQRETWQQFWSLERPYLMEKSPQSLLKIPLLRSLADGSVKTRFLIILKNPVTLNIATPKNAGWAYERNAAAKVVAEAAAGRAFEKKKVSLGQIHANANFFLDFMTHNRSVGGNCSLGWLPAMDALYEQLNRDKSRSLRDVRIVRYEQFERPNRLCRRIFEFLFDSSVSAEYNRSVSICNTNFPQTLPVASTGGKVLMPRNRGSPAESLRAARSRAGGRAGGRALLHAGGTDEATPRRDLRLRNYQDTKSFTFVPELVATTGRERVKEFREALDRLPMSAAKQISLLDDRLQQWGYSLVEWSPVLKRNLFSPWEITL